MSLRKLLGRGRAGSLPYRLQELMSPVRENLLPNPSQKTCGLLLWMATASYLVPAICSGRLPTDTFTGLPVSLKARVLTAVMTRTTLPSLVDLGPALGPTSGRWPWLFPPPGMLFLNRQPASPLTRVDLGPDVTILPVLYKAVPLPSPLPPSLAVLRHLARASLANTPGERGFPWYVH